MCTTVCILCLLRNEDFLLVLTIVYLEEKSIALGIFLVKMSCCKTFDEEEDVENRCIVTPPYSVNNSYFLFVDIFEIPKAYHKAKKTPT